MAARIARKSCFAAAGLALALSGCASSTPPENDSAPPCDLICHVLRLFDEDQPAPPPPAPVVPPAQPAPPKIRLRAQHLRAGRHDEKVHLRHEPSPAPEQDNVTLQPRSPAAPPPPPPPEMPAEPPANMPAELTAGPPPPREDPWLHPMAGSPGITPPWFEPWPAR